MNQEISNLKVSLDTDTNQELSAILSCQDSYSHQPWKLFQTTEAMD